mmetsp:Transcript_98859/g.279987  ORF Transcript_98859/g.279987 Transcript_98859/m.279987 type:complete len:147 (-) Transcript_98859:132-572(-)
METEFTEALKGVVGMIEDKDSVAFHLNSKTFKGVLGLLDQATIKPKPGIVIATDRMFDAGYPDNFITELREEANFAKVIYVSSWDTYSFIGRGNANDDSWNMNAKVGEATALAVLGWPGTNPYMKLAAVEKDMTATVDETRTCDKI